MIRILKVFLGRNDDRDGWKSGGQMNTDGQRNTAEEHAVLVKREFGTGDSGIRSDR